MQHNYDTRNKHADNWVATADTREEGLGALMFRGAVVLEIRNNPGNMRRADRLAKILNRHGAVILKVGDAVDATAGDRL